MAVPEGYEKLAVVGLAEKGKYSPEETYNYLNFVYHDETNSTYIALKDSPTTQPGQDGSESDWGLLARGVVGLPAGFGDITATVDGTTGDPHVEVSVTGEDTAKNISFTFTGLKGEKGETGDIGPTGPVGPEGKVGPQGEQGKQGISITGMKIDEENNVTIILSDGTESSAGTINLEKYIRQDEKGAHNGVATLDANGKIPSTQIPEDVGKVKGVKGGSETSYRTGEVDITKENIGLGNVENKSGATIRGEMTNAEVVKALGYTPAPAMKQIIDTKLTVSGWTGDKFPYIYEISISGLTANQLVFVHNPMQLTLEQIEAFADAGISAYSQETGKIKLQAVEKPTMELPIVIEIGGEPITNG